MQLRPTLRDIAARAGVSKTTVSLALRNNPRVAMETRKGVQAIAQGLGYRPDPILSQIAAHRWKGAASLGSTVAFITTNHPDFQRPIDHRAVAGAKQQAEALGYRLEHFRFEEYRDPERLAGVLMHRGIRGLMVGQLMEPDLPAHFPWAHFCSVACNVGFYRPPIDVIMPDHGGTMVEAWRRAEARGYRRVGVALFDEGNAVDEFNKTSAALYCQHRLPESRRIPILHYPPKEPQRVGEWAKKYKPDVVLGFNVAVYWALRSSGCVIPRDMGFIALMVDHPDRPDPVCVTGFDYDPGVLGRTAIEHLDIMLRTNRVGPPVNLSVLEMSTNWIEGDTLPIRANRSG